MKILLLTACFAVSGVLSLHNTIRFRLYDGNTSNPFIQANLTDIPRLIFESPKFDVNKTTVLVIHGFISNADNKAVRYVSDAFLDRGGFNVIGIDWRDLSYFTNFPPANLIFYPQAVDNTKLVGTNVAMILDYLITENQLLLKDIVLVGHGLGAQICGSVGRNLKVKPPVIIGLDAEVPLYQKFSTNKALSSSDGDIVHLIQTDDQLLGTNVNLGHANFRVNSGRRSKPGCAGFLGFEVACSNFRAYEYFADAVRKPTKYPANKCGIVNKFIYKLKCRRERVYMGYPPDPSAPHCGEEFYVGHHSDCRANGVYYLETNRPPPFSRNFEGTVNTYNYNNTNILP